MNTHARGFIGKLIGAFALAIGMLATGGDALSKENAVIVYLQEHWGLPKNNVLTVVFICLAVWIVLLVSDSIRTNLRANRKTCTPAEQQRARKTYLALMKKDIANRLANSIHKARYIDLQLKESTTHVSTPHFTVQNKDDEAARIIDSIDPLLDAGEFRLLLLGAPGAGKTTTVLNSMQRCIAAAMAAEDAPIPILINLSKYRKQEGSKGLGVKGFFSGTNEALGTMNLDEWLIQSMAALKRSGLTKAIISEWLKEQKVLLFLDGLDEAEELIRNLIVDKINDFIAKYSSVPVLVCSRLADYEALVNTTRVRLELDAAVVINPMTPAQITAYLAEAQVPHLQTLLDQDEALKEMARSPLDLSIMVLASRYTDFQSVTAQHTQSITRKRVALFDAYVEAMMQREKRKKSAGTHWHDADFTNIPIPPRKKEAVYRYLGWIAQLQCEFNLSTFTPRKLYEYLSAGSVQKNEVFKSNSPVQVVNGVLLLVSLSILSWWYAGRFPLAVLIGTPLLFTAANFYISLLRSGSPQTKLTVTAGAIIGWPIILLLCSLVVAPMAWVMGHWAGLGFISLIFLVIFRLIAYDSHGDTVGDFIESIKHHSKLFNLVCAVLVLMPLVFIVFFDGIFYPQWIFLYMVTVILNLSAGIEWGTSDRLLLYSNLYVLSAAIAGILFSPDPAYAVYGLFPVAMVIGLQLFAGEQLAYHYLSIFWCALAAAAGCLLFPPLTIAGFALAALTFLLIVGNGKHWYEKPMNFLGSRILLIHYMATGKLPMRLNAFLQYAVRSLLLRKNLDEYEFIHRRIRDYFAIRELLPRLSDTSAAGRAAAVLYLSRLKDASCDVLLEMIDDQEKHIREACLKGLGEIGSVTAAKSLLTAIRTTSGEMQQLSILMMRQVKDVAATPVLLRGLDEYPVDSPVFGACLQALAGNLYRLSAWDNKAKMQAYLALPAPPLGTQVAFYLTNREMVMRIRKLETVLYQLQMLEGDKWKRSKTIRAYLSVLDDADLVEFAFSGNDLASYAFPLLLERDASAFTSNMLKSIGDNHPVPYLEKPALKKIYPALESLLRAKEAAYLQPALEFLKRYPHQRLEPVLLAGYESYDTNQQKLALLVLGECGSDLCLPVISASLYQQDIAWNAVSALQRFLVRKKVHLVGVERMEDYLGVTYLRREIRTRKVIRFLEEQLKQDDPFVRKSVLALLGAINHQQVFRLLLKWFKKENTDLYEVLIPALVSRDQRIIIPQLPGLFFLHPPLRLAILSALIKFNESSAIQGIYDKLLRTEGLGSDRKDPLPYYLAAYFVQNGEPAQAVELLFDHLSTDLYFRNKGDVYNSHKPVEPGSVFGEVLKATGELRNLYSEPAGTTRKRFKEQGQLPDPSVRSVFQLKRIGNHWWVLFNIVWVYDVDLARRLCLDLFCRKPDTLRAVLLTYLEEAETSHRKALIIALIGAFDLTLTGPQLKAYVDSPDPELTGITLEVLGHLKAGWALNLIALQLQHADAAVARKAVAALVSIGDLPGYKLDNILQLVYDAKHFRLLLTDEQFAPVLQQLPYHDLLKLAAHEQPAYRYLATHYMGILGHGSTLSRLQELLEDHAAVHPLPGYAHRTVSDGALFALDKIGSPSAKAVADAWRMRLSSH